MKDLMGKQEKTYFPSHVFSSVFSSVVMWALKLFSKFIRKSRINMSEYSIKQCKIKIIILNKTCRKCNTLSINKHKK